MNKSGTVFRSTHRQTARSIAHSPKKIKKAIITVHPGGNDAGSAGGPRPFHAASSFELDVQAKMMDKARTVSIGGVKIQSKKSSYASDVTQFMLVQGLSKELAQSIREEYQNYRKNVQSGIYDFDYQNLAQQQLKPTMKEQQAARHGS